MCSYYEDMVVNKHVGSRSAAAQVLKRIYSQTKSNDITFDEIMSATGRTDKDINTNKAWLSNTLIALKYYDFVKVNYTSEFPKRMKNISLRPEGFQALDRTEQPNEVEASESSKIITPESVWNDIQILREQNPSFQIDFYIHPKEENSDK